MPIAAEEGREPPLDLAALIAEHAPAAARPVESWDPPYRGDIGLSIGADGRWHHQGSPVNRKALVKLLASVLRKEADGRTYVVTPVEKYDVHVEDAHFLAVEMWAEGEGQAQTLTFRTSVDDIVRCGEAHPLRFAPDPRSGGLKPYLNVRGRLEALLTRARYLELVDLSMIEPVGGIAHLGVWSGGSFFPMAPAASIEGLA